jgi:hypothetical protein
MAEKKKKRTHGGPRKGSGRKPVADPKFMVALYVESSIINALGGVEHLRNACYEFLKSEYSRKKNPH